MSSTGQVAPAARSSSARASPSSSINVSRVANATSCRIDVIGATPSVACVSIVPTSSMASSRFPMRWSAMTQRDSVCHCCDHSPARYQSATISARPAQPSSSSPRATSNPLTSVWAKALIQRFPALRAMRSAVTKASSASASARLANPSATAADARSVGQRGLLRALTSSRDEVLRLVVPRPRS